MYKARMSEELTTNPNVERLQKLPPQLIEAINENPEAARPYLRTIATIMYHELYQTRAAMPIGQKLAFANDCAKLGQMLPNNAAPVQAGSGFSININIPQMGAASPVTIESHATVVQDATDEACEATDGA